ncbi:ATP-binding protein [Paracrocinitomix mangrovi]|uniref:AAA family ATPase n=1 Tax=Paracrocinitomix mangrovi TaxID=2862509 RepID=UPI001C8EF36C|nr:ATP-binding protein [Paracrocinitomix mangrovi]UKN03577.1 ATP-binding protein [Paracrocinitomix mangrovi]
MKRIAITGAECSGKTTLTEQLARHYGVKWVAEYARTFLDQTDGNYSQTDLDKIAEGQLRATCALNGTDLLLSDTEMLVMKVWSEYKYGSCSPYIEQLWEEQEFDLYLLCKPDIPYEDDGLRENPNDRDELFEKYLTELADSGRRFIIIEGDHNQRLNQAIKAIDNL